MFKRYRLKIIQSWNVPIFCNNLLLKLLYACLQLPLTLITFLYIYFYKFILLEAFKIQFRLNIYKHCSWVIVCSYYMVLIKRLLLFVGVIMQNRIFSEFRHYSAAMLIIIFVMTQIVIIKGGNWEIKKKFFFLKIIYTKTLYIL